MNELEYLRTEIRHIDKEMKSLFLARCRLAIEIGKYKKEHGLPIFDANREAENKSVLLADIEDPQLRRVYGDILERIMQAAKELQR